MRTHIGDTGTRGHVWGRGDVVTRMGTWVHLGEHKDTYVNMGTCIGTWGHVWGHVWGHRDIAGMVQGARRSSRCAVNALWTAGPALGDRRRLSAVNCRQ